MTNAAALHYADTLNADGSFNVAAIMAIANAKARTERAARRCDLAGISFPRAHGQRLGDAAEFYAREAAKLHIRRYVGDWSDLVARELRAVWQVARLMRASRPARPAPIELAEAA